MRLSASVLAVVCGACESAYVISNTKPAPILVEAPADAGVDAPPLDILVGPHPVLVPLTPPAPLLPPQPRPAVKPEPCYGCGLG